MGSVAPVSCYFSVGAVLTYVQEQSTIRLPLYRALKHERKNLYDPEPSAFPTESVPIHLSAP